MYCCNVQPGMNSMTNVRERRLLDGVNRHDVVVPHRRCQSGLAQESLSWRRRGGEFRMQQFDRHDPLKLFVERLENDAEATGSHTSSTS